MKKFREWTLQQKIWRIFLAVLLMIFGCLYLGALLIPNSEIFLKFPVLHQATFFMVLLGIVSLIFFILYIIIDLAFSNQRLEDKNRDLDNKVIELEKELTALRSR
jgi:hypothetical protein